MSGGNVNGFGIIALVNRRFLQRIERAPMRHDHSRWYSNRLMQNEICKRTNCVTKRHRSVQLASSLVVYVGNNACMNSHSRLHTLNLIRSLQINTQKNTHIFSGPRDKSAYS